nr:phage tail protein [Acinetobacter baumannii]
MAALYHSLFTEKGLELLREAIQKGTKLGITEMSFGDGKGVLPVPDASFNKMVNEVYRTQLNRLAPSDKNPNWLEADGLIPSAIGGFNIREVGLWAGNVMVAYANYPPTYKPHAGEGTAQIKTVRIVLQIDNTANFELKIDASVVMATIQSIEDAKSELYQNVINIIDNFDLLNDLATWEGRTVYVKNVGANFIFNKGKWVSNNIFDMSQIIITDNFDITDVLNKILFFSSDKPIQVILPHSKTFIASQIIAPNDCKGLYLDLNGSTIFAASVEKTPKLGGYFLSLGSTQATTVMIENGILDGSLRAQNLFESTNVKDLDKGCNGVFVQAVNVGLRNLTIRHMYGQATKFYCQNSTNINVNIDDCGGHWYTNDGYDMFGDAFYIGTGWNNSGVINVSFENVTANGKHSDQYVENHQAGSPLTQVQYSRIGITLEKFGGSNNNTVYLSMNNCDFKNFERGFHQEISGIISFITLNNTNFDSCVLFGAYLTDALYASAKNCVFGFYDSEYNGSKGLSRGYSGSSFVDLDNCQIINRGTINNYQMFGTAGNLTAKNCIFYKVSGLWCSSSSVELTDCSIDVIAHSGLSYIAWASKISLKNVNISYSGTDTNLKVYNQQLDSIKKLINVSFDRIYIAVNTINLAENFRDVSITVPDDDTRNFAGSRFKVISKSNEIKQLPTLLWGVSENNFLNKRFYNNAYKRPSDSSALNLVNDDLKKIAKKISLFLIVIKAHDDGLNRLSTISYDGYASGYYLCIGKYEPSAVNSIKLLSQVISVGSTTGAGYGLTIDENLNVSEYGGYANYVHVAVVPYSEIDTLPYVPDNLITKI